MWVDRLGSEASSDQLEAPPKSGRGSGRQRWVEYAVAAGYHVEPSMTRDEIAAMVDSGPPRGPNRRALEEQVEAMATGREHRAHVEACRMLADRIDEIARAGGFSDKAWREYRLALKELREAVGDGGSSGAPIEEWLGNSRGSLRDTEDAGT